MIRKFINKEENLYNITLLVVIISGIILRIKLYLVNEGLQCDEANLARQLIDTSFFGLLKPLDKLQVAPPIFLLFSKLFYSFVKFNHTAYFSDLALRFFPLICGILTIPLFSLLLNILFRNPFVTILGTVFIISNPAVNSYSVIFKQYSLELLISVIITILFLKIDLKEKSFKYNCVIFFILFLTSMASMTSFFILAAGGIYLLIKSIKSHTLINTLKSSLFFFVPFLLYVALILIPIINTHCSGMQQYWESSFNVIKNITEYIYYFSKYMFRTFKEYYIWGLTISFFIGAVCMLIRNIKLFMLIFMPVFITFLFTVNKLYPLSERFLLFLIPQYLIIAFYPLCVIYDLVKKKASKFILIFLLPVIIISAYTINIAYSERDLFIMKKENSREIWEQFAQIYDGKTPLILGPSSNTNKYYYSLFKNKGIVIYDFEYSNNNWQSSYDKLPPGTYYLIVTAYRNNGKEFTDEIFDNFDIIDYDVFRKQTFWLPHTTGYLIKFTKH